MTICYNYLQYEEEYEDLERDNESSGVNTKYDCKALVKMQEEKMLNFTKDIKNTYSYEAIIDTLKNYYEGLGEAKSFELKNSFGNISVIAEGYQKQVDQCIEDTRYTNIIMECLESVNKSKLCNF